MGLIKRIKNSRKPLLGQIFDLIPSSIVKRATDSFQSDRYCKTYRTIDQLTALLFGQLNKCHTLRDIVIGFNVSADFLRDIGLKQSPARSTMSYGHQRRDWRAFEAIFMGVLSHYQRLFSRTAHYKSIKELQGKIIHIVDSTTISLCLNLFHWAKFRTAKGAIKIHTQLDESSELPVVVYISDGKMHDKKGLAYLAIQDGSVVIDDRGYYDFDAFVGFIKRDITFITRIKSNADFKEGESEELKDDDKNAFVINSKRISMRGNKAFETTLSDHDLRMVTVWDDKNHNELHILTNNLDWPPHVVAELYKRRWKIELFFKALKQNLQVKTFIGTSENAVKSQIYVALLAFVLLEFIRRHLSEAGHAFKQFVNLIRICLMKYQGLNYVVNRIDDTSQSLQKQRLRDDGQLSLFSTI
jgi:hypothetical protein